MRYLNLKTQKASLGPYMHGPRLAFFVDPLYENRRIGN